MPCDFSLCADSNERQLALGHLHFCRAGDVIVYDRGYYSRQLLARHEELGIKTVFRLKRKAGRQFDQFICSAAQDQIIVLAADKKDPHPRTVRLVKCPDSDWILLTTLAEARRCTPRKLADLYHQRWPIEELCKQSKQELKVESFHSKSLNGVRQELYASFTLMALSRLLAQSCENHASGPDSARRRGIWRASQKHSLAASCESFEQQLLGCARSLAETVSGALARIAECMYRERIDRSYKRVSQKPIGKWKPSKL